MSSPPPAPALKEMFDAARFQMVAEALTALDPKFDAPRFLRLSLAELDDLALMQRLRRMTESLHATLPPDYGKALRRLKQLAPRIDKAFVTLVLPDYVGLYGHGDFETSMEALKFFTRFGSSEFAVREFLKRDLPRTLAVMEVWSRDEDEHVRRLACEGCRPRLPWSFQLGALLADPAPVVPILENLKADPSLYVRKSVANHLNDITKKHPDWVMDRLGDWPLENPPTAWIARQALRTLIKKGHPRALQLIGATGKPEVLVHGLSLQPATLQLGDRFTLTLNLTSLSARTQRLVVDYAVHYVKKSGEASPKVFKWKELTLDPGATVSLSRAQTIRDFTTRVHHAGHHAVEILINGERLAGTAFVLNRQQGRSGWQGRQSMMRPYFGALAVAGLDFPKATAGVACRGRRTIRAIQSCPFYVTLPAMSVIPRPPAVNAPSCHLIGWLAGIFTVLTLLLGIAPWHRQDWLLENALVAAALLVLWAIYRYLPFSRLSWVLVFAFLCLHEIGAHYTYSEVPYHEWWRLITGTPLQAVDEGQRNHFDRLIHFCYGLFLAYRLREIYFHLARARGFWSYFLPLDLILATSALYDMIEWVAAEIFGGELGTAYVGTQGDSWDPQKDMALAVAGALITLLIMILVDRRIQRDFAREWSASVRVQPPPPP